MLSVAVHKDIAEYQPKVVGKMTGRTLASIAGAPGCSVLTGLYIYFVLGWNVGDNMMLIYAVSLPFWCCGFIRPKGCPSSGSPSYGSRPTSAWSASSTPPRCNSAVSSARPMGRTPRKEGSMGNTTESNATSRESKPTPPVQDASSADTEANFDIEQFVHTSGEGFGNDRPMDADNGSVDVAALGSVAGTPTVAGKKMSRREKKQAKREVARLKKEAKLAEKEARKSYTSVKSQLKDRDKELTSKTADARRKREGAKDVVNYIGYNRMYQDGICEVEEGLFSSSISFGDTSYHSVRDEQQNPCSPRSRDCMTSSARTRWSR